MLSLFKLTPATAAVYAPSTGSHWFNLRVEGGKLVFRQVCEIVHVDAKVRCLEDPEEHGILINIDGDFAVLFVGAGMRLILRHGSAGACTAQQQHRASQRSSCGAGHCPRALALVRSLAPDNANKHPDMNDRNKHRD